MIGNTSVQGVILGFTPEKFSPFPCKLPIPRYCNALLQSDQNFGLITGGVQDLQANVSSKATIDFQILQGTVSKKFIRVDLRKLIIDPAISLQLLPEMINCRYAHSAVFKDNIIYVLGGRQYGSDQNGLLSACEKFDFKVKKWKSLPPLQEARAASSSLIYGSHIYIFGGYSGSNKRTKIIETYSEGDNSWRKLPYCLHEGFEGGLIVKKPNSEGSILVFGGRTNLQKSNRVVEFNLDKSTVLHYPEMKQPRSFLKGKIVDSEVYLIGGGSEYYELYDIKNQQSQLNKEVSFLQCCSVKEMNSFTMFQDTVITQYQKRTEGLHYSPSRILIFGHAYQPFAKAVYTDNMTVVSEGQHLSHSFYQFTNVAKVNKEHCFVIGGISSDLAEVTNITYSYNILTNQIKPLEPMLSPRYAFGSTVLGGYLYVVGGRRLGDDDVAIISQCERFSFQTYKWQLISSMKHKRQSPTLITVGQFLLAFGGYKGNGVRANEMELFLPLQNKWVQLETKFQLSAQSMAPVLYNNIIYLFGGRGQTDIQKVFKLNFNLDLGVKIQRSLKLFLQPIGNLSNPGTNLKVFVDESGQAYVFGNIPHGIDVFDLKTKKVVATHQLPLFQKLKDRLFQAYTIIF